MNFKQFFHQQQLNEGRNITIPPEVLSAIDQNLPQIMAKTCESKKTGQRFEMNLVEFNNKYVTDERETNDIYVITAIHYWQNIFNLKEMVKDPVMQEVKRQIDQLQNTNNNQIIKIVIDPKESEQTPRSLGWAWTKKIRGVEKVQEQGSGVIENVNKIIDDNRKNIIGILDKYYVREFATNMRKLQSENNQEEINKEINKYCLPGIRYYFYEETKQIRRRLGIVNINEQKMCGKSKEEMRTLLVHEIIHCIDPKIMYRQDIKDPDHYSGPRDDLSKWKKYKSNKVEIEASIGEMVQRIFDLVNNSKNYQKTKSQIETMAQELRGAPKTSSSGFFHWIGSIMKYFDPNNLESDEDFGLYTRELTPEIKRKVLERLSNAVLQARQMLEAKYKKA